MTGWNEHMTQEMLDASDQLSTDYLEKEYEFCKEKFIAANTAANISLPATAASGKPVLHGTRLLIGDIADYWRERGEFARMMLWARGVDKQKIK